MASIADHEDGLQDHVRPAFDWSLASRYLDGLPGDALNIAHEAVGRHVARGNGRTDAIRWIGKDDSRRTLSYAELWESSGRFANLLQSKDFAPGTRVFSLLGRDPSLYTVALGAWRAGMIYSPLFAAFGPEPIRKRAVLGKADVLVTTESLYLRKVAPWRHLLSTLNVILIIGDEAHDDALLYDAELAPMPSEFDTYPTRPETPAFLHFTSGTTGAAKGALHVHGAALSHAITGQEVLGLNEGTVVWCTADPAWITGSAYGIIAPLIAGATLIVDDADYDPDRWLRRLDEDRVESWYTTPVAIRSLMRADPSLVDGRNLTALRRIGSVGEPLPPDASAWAERVLGCPIANTWWQTETGSIVLSDRDSPGQNPGALGRAVAGHEAAIVDRTEAGLVYLPDGEVGELALRAGWPSMMAGLVGDDADYASCFEDGWYLSGDLALKDRDGVFWFAGRATELIKTGGQMIGPHEVETVLLDHPAVAEAVVIGRPDDTAGEIVVAFVVLEGAVGESPALLREITTHTRRRLGPVVSPREIHVRASLPRTTTGKILRRRLRSETLGVQSRRPPPVKSDGADA